MKLPTKCIQIMRYVGSFSNVSNSMHSKKKESNPVIGKECKAPF